MWLKSLFEYTVTAEPADQILFVRIQHVRLETIAAVEQLVAAVEAGRAPLGGPCYILADISGLYISPRLRNYVASRMLVEEEWMRAIVAFARQPNHLAEMIVRTMAAYRGVRFLAVPDEPTARAAIAAYRRQDGEPPAHNQDPDPPDAQP